MAEPDRAFLVEELRRAGINPDTLVVRSQPFGELIDNETRQVFTPPLGPIAYAVCHAVKSYMKPDERNIITKA